MKHYKVEVFIYWKKENSEKDSIYRHEIITKTITVIEKKEFSRKFNSNFIFETLLRCFFKRNL